MAKQVGGQRYARALFDLAVEKGHHGPVGH